MNIAVTVDPEKPRTCHPAARLEELLVADRLVKFTEAAAERVTDGLGNCHETSVALMVDLKLAGYAAGWQWATGDTRHFASGKTRKHSWLEVDGWALDFLGGMLIFTQRWRYRHNHAKNIRLRDVRATTRWLQKRARTGTGTPVSGPRNC